MIAAPASVAGAGKLSGSKTDSFDQLRGDAAAALPRLLSAEQSNTSIAFGDRLIAKLFRRIETGLNPDLEISAYLTRRGFRHAPPLAGSLEFCSAGGQPWALALLQGFVANQGNAWDFFSARLQDDLAELRRQDSGEAQAVPSSGGPLTAASDRAIPDEAVRAFGPFIAAVERLAERHG